MTNSSAGSSPKQTTSRRESPSSLQEDSQEEDVLKMVEDKVLIGFVINIGSID